MNFVIKIIRYLWRLIPFEIRIFLSKIFWNNYRKLYIFGMPKPAKLNFDITRHFYVFGFFSSNLSHKTASDLLILEFEKKGIKYTKIDISGLHFQTQANLDLSNVRPPEDEDNVIFVVNPDIIPHIHRKIPKQFIFNKYLIGYWVYELDKLPACWIAAIDKMNEIWVPSDFVKQTFKQYSNIKIRIVPHAVGLLNIDLEKYNRKKLRQYYNIAEDDFVVMNSFSFSSSLERKNIIGCIKAFEKAFSKYDNTIFLVRYINEQNYPAAFKRLKDAVDGARCNVKLISGDEFGGGLEALYNLYGLSDAFLSLHRSEGFGLQIAEAMRFNIPAISTYYSGNKDFTKSNNSMNVDYVLIGVNDPDNIYNLTSASWAEPDLNQAAEYLKLLKNNHEIVKELKKNMLNESGNILTGSPEI